MQFKDEKILKKREEERNQQPPSLEEGFYINHHTICFSKKWIADSMSIYMPTTFMDMPAEIAQAKYPSNIRPATIITNKELDVNFGFSILGQSSEKISSHDIANQCKVNIETHQKSKCNTVQVLDKIQGYYFSYINHAPDMDIYNIQMYMQLKDHLLLSMFNCPNKQYKRWNELALFLWETIEEIH